MTYTNCRVFRNEVLYRSVENGVKRYNRQEYSPTLYIKSNSQSGYKDIYSHDVQEKHFPSIYEAKDFLKKYKDVHGFEIRGMSSFEYAFIREQNPERVVDFPNITVSTLDIETTVEHGFPNYRDPVEEITVMTVSFNDKLVCFENLKFGNFDASKAPGVIVVKCEDEATLFKRFLSLWSEKAPEVLTGYNIEGFDIPYLVSRMKRVMGNESVKKLSPWGVVTERESHDAFGNEALFVDIYGVSILDTLSLYKKFRMKKQESYKLDFVCMDELGEGKIDVGLSFKEFYTTNWQKFVEYNIQDVMLVLKLEKKLRLIELVRAMAYSAGCNYEDCFSPVKTWEIYIYNFLADQKIACNTKKVGRKEEFAGGFVGDPIPGKHEWVVAYDVDSMYPHLIMQYNISPETFVEKIRVNPEEIMERRFDTSFLKEQNLCMASNGCLYRRDKKSFMAAVSEEVYEKRKLYKKLMKAANKELMELKKELQRIDHP